MSKLPLRSADADRPVERSLSDRQIELLQLAAYGHSSVQIGHLVCLGPHTVANYLASAYDKLGANNRAHAVAIALRRHLIV